MLQLAPSHHEPVGHRTDLDEAITLADRILVLSDIPATVVADVPVTIPREKRMDAALIDEFRRRLPESKATSSSDS